MKYLTLDTEYGGVDPKCSLLTLYMAILDENLDVERELDLSLIPDDGLYVVEPEGLAVNRINLVKLKEKAITYKEAGTKVFNFLSEAYGTNPKRAGFPNEKKLTVIGHGIAGDLGVIFRTLIQKKSWETFCSYRNLCTSSAIQFLRYSGKFPDEVSGSLVSLGEYFDIKLKGKAHTAKYDALMTKEVLKKLKEML